MMSVMGDVAVKVELQQLLALMDRLKGRPPEEQIAELRKRIEEDRNAAEGGWL